MIDAQLDLVDPQLVLSAIRNLGSLSHFPSGPILERACMHIAPLLTSSDCVHLTKHLASIKRLVDMPVLGGLIHTSLLPDVCFCLRCMQARTLAILNTCSGQWYAHGNQTVASPQSSVPLPCASRIPCYIEYADNFFMSLSVFLFCADPARVHV